MLLIVYFFFKEYTEKLDNPICLNRNDCLYGLNVKLAMSIFNYIVNKQLK